MAPVELTVVKMVTRLHEALNTASVGTRLQTVTVISFCLYVPVCHAETQLSHL